MKKSDCDRKDEDVSEEVTGKNITLKEFLEVYDKIERAKDKMLHVLPNLEKFMTFCQGLEEILILYRKLYEEKKEVSTVLLSW